MRLIQVSAENFSSYKWLGFSFHEKGLHLISGPTGAGKSTLCDLVPWVLFGRTAKNGLAGDVVAWNAQEDTTGTVQLEVNGITYTVYRSRGKVNDLWYALNESGMRRGKDLADTQRMLVKELGFTAEQYLVSAYFHEMSNSVQFFATSAKNRREITEQLVDLSELVQVAKNATADRKEVKRNLEDLVTQRDYLENHAQVSRAQLKFNIDQHHGWIAKQEDKVAELQKKISNFEADKQARLAKLSGMIKEADHISRVRLADVKAAQEELTKTEISMVCQACGNKKNANLIKQAMISLQTKKDLLDASLQVKRRHEDQDVREHQTEAVKLKAELEALMQEDNPFYHTCEYLRNEVKDYTSKIISNNAEINVATNTLKLIETTIENASVVRQALIETTIREIETQTNLLLDMHFDSVMRIEFSSEEFDRLDVSIRKDGNLCSYTQLSKGQRQMLKLCFAVSCMKAAALRSNIKFEQLFFDEALDGLDDSLKIKSFSLLEQLASGYDSVYVVEHNSDMKNMFISRFEVSISNGHSTIEKVV